MSAIHGIGGANIASPEISFEDIMRKVYDSALQSTQNTEFPADLQNTQPSGPPDSQISNISKELTEKVIAPPSEPDYVLTPVLREALIGSREEDFVAENVNNDRISPNNDRLRETWYEWLPLEEIKQAEL